MTATNTAKAWAFGDNIDTDLLAPGAYMKGSIEELARHCLEAVSPDFAQNVQPGDVVVAGRNFGMGSSREQAAQALVMLGVTAVVAESFGGIFYRNALNLGLMALVCPEARAIPDGASIHLSPEEGDITFGEDNQSVSCEPVPPHLMAIVRAGGLVPHLEARFKGVA